MGDIPEAREVDASDGERETTTFSKHRYLSRIIQHLPRSTIVHHVSTLNP